MTAPVAERPPSRRPAALVRADRDRGLVVGIVLIAASALGIGFSGSVAPATIAPTGPGRAVHPRPGRRDADRRAASRSSTRRRRTGPARSPALIDVPRRVVQAVLPADPDQRLRRRSTSCRRTARPTGSARTSRATSPRGPGAVQYPRDDAVRPPSRRPDARVLLVLAAGLARPRDGPPRVDAGDDRGAGHRPPDRHGPAVGATRQASGLVDHRQRRVDRVPTRGPGRA